MIYYYMTFSSITMATKVRKAFEFDGDYFALMHTPQEIARNGCGYSLKFKAGRLPDVRRAAWENSVTPMGLYRLMPDNRYEEVPM